MYCVIQVIQRKKADLHGAYREYKVDSISICKLDGTNIKKHYSYGPDYNKGRFERLHRESYKISIHESHRKNGKVVKKQCVVGTIGYYELIEGLLFDYVEDGIQRAANVFNADFEYLYQMVEDKMQPVIDRINKEFQESEEYKAEKERKQLKKVYLETKKQFAEKYSVDANEYDCCYNIFGELMDAQYLQKIIQRYEAQQKAYQQYWEHQRKYHGSSSSAPSSNSYSDNEKKLLKKFYRALSKDFHPDLHKDQDTTEAMQLINRLKEQWGV